MGHNRNSKSLEEGSIPSDSASIFIMRLLVKSTLRVLFEIESDGNDIKIISVTDGMKKDLGNWLQCGLSERIMDEQSGYHVSRHTEPTQPEFLPRLAKYSERYGFAYFLKD